MPITYKILMNGHLIHSIAAGKVSKQNFIDYEIQHAKDENLKSPVSELFEIRNGAFDNLSKDDIKNILDARINTSHIIHHKCALVVSMNDHKGWDLAKFYENLMMLHQPASVIVFGDIKTAKTWFGIK